MAINVASYIKNLGLSVAYSTTEAIQNQMPAMKTFTETNQEVYKTVYKSVINYRQTLNRASGIITSSKIFKAADAGIANIKSDIMTGKFYNKDRINKSEEKAAMDMMGDDDFDTDGFDMDFGDDDFNDQSTDVIENAVKDSAEMTAMTIAKSSECIIDNQRQISTMEQTQNILLVNSLKQTIGDLGNNMSQGINITNDILKTHVENSRQFYESTNAMLTETNQMLKQLIEMNQKTSAKASERGNERGNRFSDITSDGMPDLTKYFNIIKENIKDAIPSYDILFGDAMGGANILETLAASPLQFIPTMIARMLIPASLGVAMKDFDKSVSGLFGGMIARMNKMKDSDNPIVNVIGKILGIDNSLKTTINTSNYEKGAVPFDGITRKSIVEVIPGYLRRIEGLLSGKGERLFDFENARWTDVESVKKDFDSIKESSIRSGSGDTGRSMRQMLNRTRFSSKEQQDKVTKDFNKIFEKIFMDGGQFDPYGALSGGENSADDMYLEYGVDSLSFGLFMKMWEAIPKSTRNTLAKSMVSARDRHTKRLSNDEKEGISIFGTLFNGDNLNSNIKKNSYGDIEESYGVIGNSLLNAKDNFGNNVFYYLQNLHSNIAALRQSLVGDLKSSSSGYSSSNNNYIANNIKSYNKKKTKEQEYRDEVKKYNDSWKDLDDENYIKLDYYGMSDDEMLDKASLKYIEMQRKMSEDEIKEFKGGDSSFDNNESDEVKAKKNQARMNRLKKGNLLERLLAAETLGQKAQAITDSLYNISTKPAEMLGGILAKADARIYDFMFGKEVKDERDEKGNPIRGFFDHMILKINNSFNNMLTYFQDHIMTPLKDKMGEMMDGLAKKLGFENFDDMKDAIKKKLFDEDEGIFGGVVKAVKDNFRGAWEEVKGSFKSVDSEVRDTFNEYMGIEKPEDEKDEEAPLSEELKAAMQKKEDLKKSFELNKDKLSDIEKLKYEDDLGRAEVEIEKQKILQELNNSGMIVDKLVMTALNKASSPKQLQYVIDKKLMPYLKNSANTTKIKSRETQEDAVKRITKKLESQLKTSQDVINSANVATTKYNEKKDEINQIEKAKIEAAEQHSAIIENKTNTAEIKTQTSSLVDILKETLDHIKDIARSVIDIRDIIRFKSKSKEEQSILKQKAEDATVVAEREVKRHAADRHKITDDIKAASKIGHGDSVFFDGLVEKSAEVARAAQDKAKSALRAAGIIDRDKEFEDNKKGIIDTIEEAVQEHAAGTRMVTKSGITTISKGEMVLPSDMNPFNPDRNNVNRKAEIEDEQNIKRDFAKAFAESAIKMNADGNQPIIDGEIEKNRLLAKYNNIDINNATDKELNTLANSMAQKQMELDNRSGKKPKPFGEYYEKARKSIWKDQKSRSITESVAKSDFAQVGGEAISRLIGGNSDRKALSEAMGEAMEKAHIIVPDAIGKGLVGGTIGLFSGVLGGPLLGASIGVATAFVNKSEKAQKWLFGDKIVDEDGNDTGKRTGGVFSAELQETVKKYFPDMKKYGIVGGVLGLAGPMGPIGGLLMGSAIGYIKNNDRVREAMFGDEGLLSKDRRQKIKKAFPSIAAGALAGLFMGPFGLVGNAILGSAVGMASTTDGFKDLVLGEMNEDGEREGGIVGALKDNIVDPIKEAVIDLKDKAIDFITEKMIAPITDAIKPLAKQFSLMVKGIGGAIIGGITGFMNNNILNPLGTLVKEKFLDPVGNFLKGFLKIPIKLIGGVLTAPSKLIGGLGNMARRSQIKSGNADYMSAEDRNEWRATHRMNTLTGFITGSNFKKNKWTHIDESIAGMDADNVMAMRDNLKALGSTKEGLDKERRSIQRKGYRNINKYFDDAGLSGRARKKILEQFDQGADVSDLINKYRSRGGKRLDEDTRNALIDEMGGLREQLNKVDAQKKLLKTVSYDSDEIKGFAESLGISTKQLKDPKLRKKLISLLDAERTHRVGFNDDLKNEALKSNPANAKLEEINTKISDQIDIILKTFPKIILEGADMSDNERKELIEEMQDALGERSNRFEKMGLNISSKEKENKEHDKEIKSQDSYRNKAVDMLVKYKHARTVENILNSPDNPLAGQKVSEELVKIIVKSDNAIKLLKNAHNSKHKINSTAVFVVLKDKDLERLAVVAKYNDIPSYNDKHADGGKDIIDYVLSLSDSDFEKLKKSAKNNGGNFPLDKTYIEQILDAKDTNKYAKFNGSKLQDSLNKRGAGLRRAGDDALDAVKSVGGVLSNVAHINLIQAAAGTGKIAATLTSAGVRAAYHTGAGIIGNTLRATSFGLDAGTKGIENKLDKSFNEFEWVNKFYKLGLFGEGKNQVNLNKIRSLGKTGCKELLNQIENDALDASVINSINVVGRKPIIDIDEEKLKEKQEQDKNALNGSNPYANKSFDSLPVSGGDADINNDAESKEENVPPVASNANGGISSFNGLTAISKGELIGKRSDIEKLVYNSINENAEGTDDKESLAAKTTTIDSNDIASTNELKKESADKGRIILSTEDGPEVYEEDNRGSISKADVAINDETEKKRTKRQAIWDGLTSSVSHIKDFFGLFKKEDEEEKEHPWLSKIGTVLKWIGFPILVGAMKDDIVPAISNFKDRILVPFYEEKIYPFYEEKIKPLLGTIPEKIGIAIDKIVEVKDALVTKVTSLISEEVVPWFMGEGKYEGRGAKDLLFKVMDYATSRWASGMEFMIGTMAPYAVELIFRYAPTLISGAVKGLIKGIGSLLDMNFAKLTAKTGKRTSYSEYKLATSDDLDSEIGEVKVSGDTYNPYKGKADDAWNNSFNNDYKSSDSIIESGNSTYDAYMNDMAKSGTSDESNTSGVSKSGKTYTYNGKEVSEEEANAIQYYLDNPDAPYDSKLGLSELDYANIRLNGGSSFSNSDDDWWMNAEDTSGDSVGKHVLEAAAKSYLFSNGGGTSLAHKFIRWAGDESLSKTGKYLNKIPGVGALVGKPVATGMDMTKMIFDDADNLITKAGQVGATNRTAANEILKARADVGNIKISGGSGVDKVIYGADGKVLATLDDATDMLDVNNFLQGESSDLILKNGSLYDTTGKAVAKLDDGIADTFKLASSSVDDVAEAAGKVAANSVDDAAAAAGKKASTIAEKAGEYFVEKAAKTEPNTLIGKFVKWVRDALGEFFQKSTVYNKIKEVVEKVIGEPLAKFDALYNKALLKFVDLIISAVEKTLGESAANVLSDIVATIGLGGLNKVADAVIGFTMGMVDADKIWDVKEPTILESLAAGILNAVSEAFLFGLLPVEMLIDCVVGFLSIFGVEFEDLQKRRTELLEEMDKYNEENGTKYTDVDDYLAKDELRTKIKEAFLGKTNWETGEREGGIWGGIKKGASTVWSGFKDTVGIEEGDSFLTGLGKTALSAGKTALQTLNPLAWFVGNSVMSSDSDEDDKNSVSGYADGTLYVDKTGIAAVSKGEMIIPSDMNPFNPDKDNTDRTKEKSNEQNAIKTLFDKIFNGSKENPSATLKSIDNPYITTINETFNDTFSRAPDAYQSLADTNSEYLSKIKDCLKVSDADLKVISSAQSGKIKVFSDEYNEFNPSDLVKDNPWISVNNIITDFFKGISGISIGLTDIFRTLQPVTKAFNAEMYTVLESISDDVLQSINDLQGLMADVTSSINKADMNASNSSSITNLSVNYKSKNTTTSSNTSKSSGFIGKAISTVKKVFSSIGTNVKNLFGFGEGPEDIYEQQTDPSIRNMSFNSRNDSVRQTMNDSGCAPVVAANLINMVSGGKVVDSQTMAREAIAGGYKEPNSGVRADYFEDTMSRYGIGSSTLTSNSDIDKSLSSGRPTVLLGTSNNNGPYTKAGHYILATGKDSNGNILVRDPRHKGLIKYNKNSLLNNTQIGIATGSGSGSASIGNIISNPLKGLANIYSKLNIGNNGNSAITNEGSLNGNTIILPSGLGSIFAYMGWQCITNITSAQYKLREQTGQNFDSEGFGVINGRYVVATTTTFGKVGDYIDVYQSDGTVFQCIIGDIKSQGDAGCNKWGHNNGQCVIEFIVDKETWYSNGKGSHSNPGTDNCHPEWGGKTIVKIVNGGSYFSGSGVGAKPVSVSNILSWPAKAFINKHNLSATNSDDITATSIVSSEPMTGTSSWTTITGRAVTVNYLPTSNQMSRPGIKLKGPVRAFYIHYTASPKGSATSIRDYFAGVTRYAGTHYVVGLNGEIIQMLPEDEVAWHCGANDNYYSIATEVCHPDESGKFSDVTYQAVVDLAVDICFRYGLNPSTGLKRHYDANGKLCPKYYVEHEDAWNTFKQDVANKLAKYNGSGKGISNAIGLGEGVKTEVSNRLTLNELPRINLSHEFQSLSEIQETPKNINNLTGSGKAILSNALYNHKNKYSPISSITGLGNGLVGPIRSNSSYKNKLIGFGLNKSSIINSKSKLKNLSSINRLTGSGTNTGAVLKLSGVVRTTPMVTSKGYVFNICTDGYVRKGGTSTKVTYSELKKYFDDAQIADYYMKSKTYEVTVGNKTLTYTDADAQAVEQYLNPASNRTSIPSRAQGFILETALANDPWKVPSEQISELASYFTVDSNGKVWPKNLYSIKKWVEIRHNKEYPDAECISGDMFDSRTTYLSESEKKDSAHVIWDRTLTVNGSSKRYLLVDSAWWRQVCSDWSNGINSMDDSDTEYTADQSSSKPTSILSAIANLFSPLTNLYNSILGTSTAEAAESTTTNNSSSGSSSSAILDEAPDTTRKLIEIIAGEEGSYTTVEPKDGSGTSSTPYNVSLGRFQWYNDRARNLLTLIRDKNNSLFDSKASDNIKKYTNNELTNFYTSKGSADYNSLVDILGTDESKEVQDSLAVSDVTSYLTEAKNVGITDPKASLYYADIVNQYGTVNAKQFLGDDNSLEGLYSRSKDTKFASRRTKVYNAVKDLDLTGTGLGLQGLIGFGTSTNKAKTAAGEYWSGSSNYKLTLFVNPRGKYFSGYSKMTKTVKEWVLWAREQDCPNEFKSNISTGYYATANTYKKNPMKYFYLKVECVGANTSQVTSSYNYRVYAYFINTAAQTQLKNDALFDAKCAYKSGIYKNNPVTTIEALQKRGYTDEQIRNKPQIAFYIGTTVCHYVLEGNPSNTSSSKSVSSDANREAMKKNYTFNEEGQVVGFASDGSTSDDTSTGDTASDGSTSDGSTSQDQSSSKSTSILSAIANLFSPLTNLYNSIFGTSTVEAAESTTTNNSSGSGGLIPDGTKDSLNNWAYYKQGDSRWGNKSYGNGTYSDSACGPTAMAMITTGLLGKKYYPTEFPDKYGTILGTTSWDGFATVANDYGLTNTTQFGSLGNTLDADGLKKYKAQIDAGHPVILSGNSVGYNKLKRNASPFTTDGHFVVSHGYIADSDGNIKSLIINNPAGESGEYTNLTAIKEGTKQLWAFGVSDPSKAPTPASGNESFPIVSTIKGSWPTSDSSGNNVGGASSGETIGSYLYRTLLADNDRTNISSHYGESRSDGVHYAMDIGMGGVSGVHVHSPISGTIYSNQTQRGGGWCLGIKDKNGNIHTLMHLAKKPPLSVGSNVKVGDDIGEVGGTSANEAGGTALQNVYARHVHWQIASKSQFKPDIDPEKMLAGDNPVVTGCGNGIKIGPNMLNPPNKREIGGPVSPQSINYTELIQIIIELLTKLVNNTAAISKLCNILETSNDPKLKGIAKEIKSTTGSGEGSTADFSKLKRRLKNAQNTGSDNGLGTLTAEKDVQYIANIMKKLVTE